MTTTTIPDTRTVRIEGVATLLSSMSHSDGHAGTISLFRRERIAQLSGPPVEVPVVSGNGLRGILRDHCAHVFWSALGRPELPPAIFDLLWSGGSLAKAGAGHVLSARQLSDVRRLVPMVSLFGGSGAGKIIEGKLRVQKLTPVCAETAHVLPESLIDGDLVACRDLLQVEEFSRRDDAKRDLLHPAIEGMAPRELPAGDGAKLLADDELPPADLDRVMQMRYGVETLSAGTRLHWGMTLTGVTDAEVSLFARGVDAWLSDGAHVGGRSATGHGRLRLDCHQWEHQTPSTTVGEALQAVGRDDLDAHVSAHGEQILEALGWFG